MNLTGIQSIAAPRLTVWEALKDPVILKQCLPGCESVAPKPANVFLPSIPAWGWFALLAGLIGLLVFNIK